MLNQARPGAKAFQLFWISCWMLFFEILLIRWLSAEIRIFAYFHNLVLLFCFLGIGLGCAIPNRQAHFLLPFSILAFLSFAVALPIFLGPFAFQNLTEYLSRASDFVIWQKATQELQFDLLKFGLGIILSLLLMSLLILFFVPFGQVLGKRLNEERSPLRGYGINLLGSLAGIWLFTLLSAYSLPPSFWVGTGGVALLLFLSKRSHIAIAVCLVAFSIFCLYESRTPDYLTIWSPYQKLNVTPLNMRVQGQNIPYGHAVQVNSIGYMIVSNYSADFQAKYPFLFPANEVPYDHYNLAFRFAPDPEKVLVLGSGAGNDVAGALRNGAQEVTAVEIDPEIIQIGDEFHRELPYKSPRVRVVNEDARTFLRTSQEKYDVVLFGLLDSHTLSSSYSNVRLDNYVYTVESFRQATQLLKPDGLLFVIFEVRDDFIGARLFRMLSEVSGQSPIGILVRSHLRGWGGYCFLIGNRNTIDQRIADDPKLTALVSESQPKYETWSKLDVDVARDDWPYLYLPSRKIPTLFLFVFALLILLSYVAIRTAVGRKFRIQWPFFFFGAAFLLLEVQNISKFALLFGATWTVNTIVISMILVMALLANYVCARKTIKNQKPVYIALFGSLLLSYFLPVEMFSGLTGFWKLLLPSALLTLPVFFAGIIFSTSFAKEEDRSAAFASNLLGAMVGGVSECLSFLTGIQALLLLCAFFYLLAAAMSGAFSARGLRNPLL